MRQIMWDALKAHCIIMGPHHDHQLIQRNTCLDGTGWNNDSQSQSQ